MIQGVFADAESRFVSAQLAPSISVVTPSLNQHEFLEATLRSVVSQGYRKLEYVVIDGGSTDGSVEIIRRYESHLAYWVSERDRGHADAVNKGFAHTSGDIMCWINSSDMYYPWTLATVAEIFADLPDVDWIVGVPSWFGFRGGPRAVATTSGALNMYDALASRKPSLQQESVFWRRRLWDLAGGSLNSDLKFAADLDLWLRFFRLTKLYHVPTILGGFRIHDDRLGAGERYAREVEALISQFAAERDQRTWRRARMLRAVGSQHGQTHVLSKAFAKLGICSWYRHPQIIYDFDAERWTVR
ncbi:MAG: glycosyltransferase family 2 protein [Ferrimicrobium sp.]